ncbi:hypothetical protein B0T16DRAFT_316951 [Cercophora newfieldiana]|uniref:3-beta hydroxysteroid dehydrogenase/isomerase domain-containing protein n=1 Tax=Cercophora newfieldiana TaxID=92897 RepID=A0AA39YQ50_9PEZI|nr:hypothetical protein B0T16DRAFT_316951 [Cercophora newfieldiana]
MGLLLAAAITSAIALLWLYRINLAMQAVPAEAIKASPRRWTRQEIRETYERVSKTPSDFSKQLPPALKRRYVVFGGAGMVGGDVVMQLLQRGQSPESIRIVDFQGLNRRDMLEKSKDCDVVKADMTSWESVEAAFSKPWPVSVAKLPLTVFHTAARIHPGDRSERLYERMRKINFGGTVNVLKASKAAGADIFVATASASISFVPAEFCIWPWQSVPRNYFHVTSEADFDVPIRPHSRFFSNYSKSKAEAERLICDANEDGFRTGTIRPGNAIYGQKTDPVLGSLLTLGESATWMPHVIQNFVDSRNVALAHLLFEAALTKTTKASGRPFVVTDPGPPLSFQDLYDLVIDLSVTPVSVMRLTPVILLLVTYVVEAYVAFVTFFPFLQKLGLKEPGYPLSFLQPSVIKGSVHVIVDDTAIRRSFEEGGLGYKGVCTSLEGMCEELADWNREHESK